MEAPIPAARVAAFLDTHARHGRVALTVTSTIPGPERLMTINPSGIFGKACVDDPAMVGRTPAADAGSPQTGSSELVELQHQLLTLRRALETRGAIGRAQGILMERFGIDADAAFRLLVEMSQRTHLKLRDVAARVDASATTSSEIGAGSTPRRRGATVRKGGR